MINFFNFPKAILCLAIGCTLGLASQSQAAIVSFTAENGPSGKIYQSGTNHQLGAFFFNIFDGNPSSIGVYLSFDWDLPGEVQGFHVDFTGGFSSPRTISSAIFTNLNNLGDNNDDTLWSSVSSGLLSTSTLSIPGDTVATGEWFGDEIRFNTTTQGSLGFEGYLELAQVNRSNAPEPGTWLMLVTGLLGVGIAVKVSRRETQQRSL